MININLKYDDIFKFNINETSTFDDGLSITLSSFSHKHSLTGGPTKATAYLNLDKGNVTEQILLSVHGTDGKPEVEHYDSRHWNEYEFQLKSFNYDKDIELIVTKRN